MKTALKGAVFLLNSLRTMESKLNQSFQNALVLRRA